MDKIKKILAAVAAVLIAVLVARRSSPKFEVEPKQDKAVEDFLNNEPESPPELIQPEFKPSSSIDEAIDRWNGDKK